MNSSITTIKDTDTDTYFTNDIKLTAGLVTAGFSVVKVKTRENPRNKKTEILFGFEHTEEMSAASMRFLSCKLAVDAKTILDNRDSLLSYVANGSRELLDKVNPRTRG
jgi:hypothetical protein